MYLQLGIYNWNSHLLIAQISEALITPFTAVFN